MSFQSAHPIIQAFLAGKDLASQKQERTDKLAKEAQDRQDRIAAQQEAIRQHEEELKQHKEEFDLTHKLSAAVNEIALAKARSDFQGQFYESGGELPPGYKQSDPLVTNVDAQSGIVSTRRTLSPTDEKSTLPTFDVTDPETHYQNLAHVQEIMNAPKLKGDLLLKQIEAQIKANEVKQSQIFTAAQDEKKFANAKEVARIRSQATNDPTKKLEIWYNTPVDATESQTYNVPAGTLHKDIVGMRPGLKLTPEQDTKITYLKDMLKDAVDAQILLDKSKGGKGYENYFYGKPGISGLLSGAPTELLAKAKGENDETDALIRNKLGTVFDKRKVESAGKVLNAAELKLLQNYVPPYEHTLNPIQAKTNLEQFITGTSKLINDLQSQYAPKGKVPSLEQMFEGVITPPIKPKP